MTHWDLGENVEEQGDNGEVEADPGPSEPLLQVLGHRDHLISRDVCQCRKSQQFSVNNTLGNIHVDAIKWSNSLNDSPRPWGTQVQTTSLAAARWTEPDTWDKQHAVTYDTLDHFSSPPWDKSFMHLLSVEEWELQICTSCEYIELLTFHSNPPTAMPLAAPVPAKPTKWPLPMLLANRDAPTWKKQKPNK